MTIISSAQQIINQVVPNITGGATDLVQAFRGSFGADTNVGVTSAGNQPDFGSQLEEATSRDRISFDRPDNRSDTRADNNRPNDRSDRPESRADDRRDSRADRASDDRDAGPAERSDRPAGDDRAAAADRAAASDGSRYNSSDYSGSEELGVAAPSGAVDAANNAQQNGANDNAAQAAALAGDTAVATEAPVSGAGEDSLGEAGELLAQAEGLLAQLEAFQLDNPELASELGAIIAPIQQALQQITTQLSALPADAAVTPSALNGNPADALSQLRQISGLFGGLQQAGSVENLAQSLGSAPISEEFSQALRALQNTAGPSLQRVNELVESFRQLVTNANAAPVDTAQVSADQARAQQAIQQAAQQTLSAQQAQAGAQTQLANGQAAANAANASAAADGAAQADAESANQPANNNVQGVAQLGAANQANQQQAPGAANASANGQAQGIQQAAQNAGGRGDAAASSSAQLAAASSSSSAAPQPNAAAVSIPTTSVTLTREAASFAQALQQSGRASVAEQVQVQVKTLIRNGQSRVSVTLNPEELGRVDIRLDTDRSSRTQVVVSVERPQTLELLQRDARVLLQTLQDAGLQADSEDLAFDLKGGNDSSGGHEQQARSGYPTTEEPLEEDLLSNVSGVVSENYTVELEQGVNIHA